MAETRNDRFERLADREEIRDVMFRWCRAVDRRRFADIREVFHPDGYDDHGIYKGGVEGLIAWLTERHRTIVHSTHLIGNMLIEFVARDAALVETYAQASQRYGVGGAATRAAITGGSGPKDDAFDMVISGRYVDRFERRDGHWRIAHRTTVFDSSMIFPLPATPPQMGADWAVGRRDESDPLWQIREKSGLA
jgi:hypothetical protein